MSTKGRAKMTSMNFLGAWPRNESKRFFFIRYNFEYVDQPWNRDPGFSKVVVNRKPLNSSSRDPYVLKEQMMDAGIARREVPKFYQRAAEQGRFEKVVDGMAEEGIIDYTPSISEVEIAEELPEELQESKPDQPELFDPEEMKKTRRPFGHWMSWYGRQTMKREGADKQQEILNAAVETWEWWDEMPPETFAEALREAGADPKYVDLGSIGKYIVAKGDVYDVDYHDSGKSVAEFIWGLSDFELMQYAEEQHIQMEGGWDNIGIDDVAYHCTSSDNVQSIMENGLSPRNKTRGLSNQGTGASVFMTFEPSSAESYGDACFEIYLGAMKEAGVTPEIQQEDPIVEAKIRGAIANRLGDDSGDWGESELASEGIDENTFVLFGTIPPEFIKLYSGPEELMEQYASGDSIKKTAAEEFDILEYVEQLREPYAEMTNIEQLDPESELDDEDWTGSNLYDILHDVFEWSAKIAMWKASGNPMHERKIDNLTDRMERYADLAITYIKSKMQDWLDNHFDWDKWWSGMAYAYMANGQDVRRHYGATYPIDIREEIAAIAQQRMFDDIYSFVDEFPDEKIYWLKSNPEICTAFLRWVKDDPDVQEWMQEDYNDPETACDDPEEFVYDCDLATSLGEFVYEHEEEYEQFIRSHYGDPDYVDFDELKMRFDVDTWGKIVEEAAKKADVYQQWKNIFPGLEETEEGIQKAVAMLENAQTPDQKVGALSYALNVGHYFGNFMRERIEDESLSQNQHEELEELVEKIENITPLDYDQLEALSNIDVVAGGEPVDKTAQTWVKGQVFVDKLGDTYDVDKLIDITSKNHVFKVPVQDLQPQLFDDAWGENGRHLSPMDVLNNPTKNREFVEHMQDIRTANMDKPIIIRKTDAMVVDGYHRLARALLEGRPWIEAVFAEPEQMNEARVV